MIDRQQLSLEFAIDPEIILPRRLYELGLPGTVKVTPTRNRTVMVSWDVRTGVRIHAGYAAAPDAVLRQVIAFISPRVPRTQRLKARRELLAFPVHEHAPLAPDKPPFRPVQPDLIPISNELTLLHRSYNNRYFGGKLTPIPVTVSTRMVTQLGKFRIHDRHGWSEIIISARHLDRDCRRMVSDTLLHEMVHQWQQESGLPLGHGRDFKRKARELGIVPSARISISHLRAASDSDKADTWRV